MIPLRQELLTGLTHAFVVNDDQLEDLHAAASDIAKAVAATPAKLVPYALVAVEPGTTDDAPPLVDAEQAILSHWQALRSQHKPRPTALLRYVLLVGLHEATTEAPLLAAALYLTIADPVRRSAPSTEAAVLRNYLTVLSVPYDAAATKAMETAKVEFQEPKAGKPLVALAPAAKDVLTKALDAAVQNSEIMTAAGHMVHPAWAVKFSSEAAEALKVALDSVGATASKALEARLAADEQVLKILRDTAQANAVTERRVELLWWAQARYSQRLRLRYRELGPWGGAIAMAEDLWQLAPDPIAPEVEALLEEVHLAVFGEQSTREASLLEGLKQVTEERALGDLGAPSIQKGRRLPLCDLIRGLRAGTLKPTEAVIKEAIGLSGKLKLAPAALGVWHLRTRSAGHLVNQ